MFNKTATEIVMFMDECEEITKEHFKKLETHIQNEMHASMYKALASGSNVFFTGPYTCATEEEDNDWMPEAEREFQEMQGWIEEYPPFDWATWKPYATLIERSLLKEKESSLLLEKFGRNLKNNFVDSRSTVKTIKFRRYDTGRLTSEKGNSEEVPRKNTHSQTNNLAQGWE